MAFRRRSILIATEVLLIPLTAALCLGAATNEVQFNRDVRPILSENCYACHGPDKNQRKAKLRLDVREVALEHEAIQPGRPSGSKPSQPLFSTHPDGNNC